VGQGGYGQVYLASKKDTKEVCALKVMSKKLLFKLDEIRHILTERDILTAASSEWLVKLLYAFQDEKSIYLAMVRENSGAGESHELTKARNMSQEETFERYSIIPEFFIIDMHGFILQRCSRVSMPSIS
jgi:serine/threonine protein kinase